MKWRNSKERELLSQGGTREQTLPSKDNQNPDLSDPLDHSGVRDLEDMGDNAGLKTFIFIIENLDYFDKYFLFISKFKIHQLNMYILLINKHSMSQKNLQLLVTIITKL